MAEPVLDLKDVVKNYGKTQALKGVSLSIAPGEIVGLLGPNGAGKSTLFQLASGLFAPDGGSVRVFGMDYKTKASAILARLGVMFQMGALFSSLTVLQNVQVPMREHLDLSQGLLFAERATFRLAQALGKQAAHELTTLACQRAVATGKGLKETLSADPKVTGVLTASDLDAVFDPAAALGSTQGFIDRVLATAGQG